jgi:hypothetical protein
MNTSKDLICLANIEKTLEILNSLKNQQQYDENHSLNVMWNYLLDIRDRQIELLQEHDQFKLLDRFKKVNLDVKEIQTQTHVIQQQTYHYGK